MPSDRLLDGYGVPTATFPAPWGEEAKGYGIERAGCYPRPEPRFGARRDFQVHRQDGEGWRLLLAWPPSEVPAAVPFSTSPSPGRGRRGPPRRRPPKARLRRRRRPPK